MKESDTMPHKQPLRHFRAISLETNLEHTRRFIQRLGELQIESKKRALAIAEARRNIRKSIEDMIANKDHYDYGPVQTKALHILREKAKKIRTAEDIDDILRLTCFQKLSKR